MKFNARKLQNLREKNGMTRTEFAHLFGLKPNTYANYESGRRDIKLSVLCEICEYFDVTADYFLDAVDHPYPLLQAKSEARTDIILKAAEVMEFLENTYGHKT